MFLHQDNDSERRKKIYETALAANKSDKTNPVINKLSKREKNDVQIGAIEEYLFLTAKM